MNDLKRLLPLLLIGLFLTACVKLGRKESTKFKKALRSQDGVWEVSLNKEYTIGNSLDVVAQDFVGVIGEFEFTKGDGSLPSTNTGTWTPVTGNSQNILYRVSTDDSNEKTITMNIFYDVNGDWESDYGNEVSEGWSKTQIDWSTNATIGLSDTIERSYYSLTN